MKKGSDEWLKYVSYTDSQPLKKGNRNWAVKYVFRNQNDLKPNKTRTFACIFETSPERSFPG